MDSGANSYLVELKQKQLHIMGSLLEQGVQNPNKLSVLEFFSLVNRYREIQEQYEKQMKRYGGAH